mgnify:FL=1
MNNNMEYKGYLGSVEFSEEEAVFFGKIMNIRSLISYEGKNVMELSEQFREAVDEYSSICEQQLNSLVKVQK